MSKPQVSIVLLPGLLNDHTIWDGASAVLAKYGEVSVPEYGPVGDLANLADAVLEAAPEQFLLAGFSMGGYLALEVMRRAPERVLGLALVSTSARADTADQQAMREKIIAAVQRGKYDKVVAGTTEGALASGGNADRYRDQMASMATAIGPDNFCEHMRAVLNRRDSRAQLPLIKVPTLVAVGEEDQVVPPEFSRELAAAIEGAELAVIPGSGHMLPLQGSEALNASLCEWVERVLAKA